MAITDINISEQLQTDAPSIKYTGNEGPQASPQHQQEQMIARQIWDALGPEQQGQFQSFEKFFQSGIWKQILQQMQADEGQGPETQQGIGSLGPEPMQQQMPAPNRMGAQYGGRMGYADGTSEGEVNIRDIIKEKITNAGDVGTGIPGIKSIWIEKLIEHLKKRGGRPDPRGEITQEEIIEELRPRNPRNPIHPMPMRPMPRRGARLGGDMEELSMRETIDTPEGIETLKETDTMQMAGGGARGWKAQMLAEDLAQEEYGKDFYDLSQDKQMEIYQIALDMIDSGGQ